MPPPIKPPKDKLSILYQAVGEEYDLGTPEDFRKMMLEPENRKVFFETVGAKYNLGESLEKFDQLITASYPQGVPYQQPTPQPGTENPMLKGMGSPIPQPVNTAATKPDYKKQQEQQLATDLKKQQEKEGFWSSAGTMITDFFANTAPKALANLQLMGVALNYDDYLNQVNYGAPKAERRFKLAEEDFINNPKEVYSYLTSGDRDVKRFKAELEATQKAYPQGGREAFVMFRDAIQNSQLKRIEGYIEEVETQKGESQERTKNVVQTYKDVNSFADLLSYTGGLTGQGAATSSTILIGGGSGAFFLETAGAYEENVEEMMRNTGKSRMAVESSPEMKKKLSEAAISVGAMNAILEKVGFGEASKPLKNVILDMISKKALTRDVVSGAGGWVTGTLAEGGTETLQDINTQYQKLVANGMSPEQAIKSLNVESIINSAIGGTVGGGSMTLAAPTIRGAVKGTQKIVDTVKGKKAVTAAEVKAAEKKAAAAPAPAPAAAPQEPAATTATAPAPAAKTETPPATTEAPAPKQSGLVQGQAKISDAPLSTDKDAEGNTIQTWGTGLTDKNGDQITIESITDPEGNVVHQALGGEIVGNSREDVVKQLEVMAGRTPVTEEKGKEPEQPSETTTEKTTEKVTTKPEGGTTTEKTVTKTTKAPVAEKPAKGVKSTKIEPNKDVEVAKAEVHTLAKEVGVDINTPSFKQGSKALTGKEHLDDMTVEELAKVKAVLEFEKKKRGTTPSGTPAPAPGKTVAQEKTKSVDFTNVPAIQQRTMKKSIGEGWVVSGKKNLKSSDGKRIYPILEMKRGNETQYINTKGDVFTNINDALAKSEGRPEIKKGKTPEAKKPEPVKTPPQEKKQEEKPKPVEKKEEKPKKLKAPSAAKAFNEYTTDELRKFIKNASPQDRVQYKEMFEEMAREIDRRTQRKAKKTMERNREKREGREPEAEPKKDPKPEPKQEEKPAPPPPKPEPKAESAPEKTISISFMKKPSEASALTEKLWKVTSLREGLQLIAESNSHYAALAKWLLENGDAKGLNVRVSDAPILRSNNGGEAAGHYRIAEDDIELSQKLKDAYRPYAFIHEGLHALASQKIMAIVGIRNTRDDAVLFAFADKANPRDKNIANLIKAYRKAKEVLAEQREDYGIVNLDEFLSEGLSNPTFQEKLNEIPFSGGKSVWQVLVDAVKGLLGMDVKQGTVLEAFLQEAGDLISRDRNPVFDEVLQRMRAGKATEADMYTLETIHTTKTPESKGPKKTVAEELPKKTGKVKDVLDEEDRNKVSEESQRVLEYLALDMFPTNIDDFMDAIADLEGYGGVMGSVKARARLDQMVREGVIKVTGKRIYPTFVQQGNEFAPQTLKEYAPVSGKSIKDENKSLPTPSVLIQNMLGDGNILDLNLPQMVKTKSWLKEKLKKAGAVIAPEISHRGGKSDAIYNAINGATFAERKYQARAIASMKKLKAQVKKDYKKITQEQVTELNLALQGKTTKPNGDPIVIPQETMKIIVDLRLQVDNLSRTLVREGVIEGHIAAKILDNMGTYLHRSYEKFDNPLWSEQVGQDVYNRAMVFLRQTYPGYAEPQIKALVDWMLLSPDAPMSIMKGGNYGAMDLSALKKRGDIAPEIRALWGEYADPVTNFARTIGKMSQMVAKHLFQQDVYNQGIADDIQAGEDYQTWLDNQVAAGKFLFKERAPGFLYQIQASTTGAPTDLNGLWTTKENAEILGRYGVQKTDQGPLLEAWVKIASAANKGLTVYNPGTHFRNFFSNSYFAIANGHVFNFAKRAKEKPLSKAEYDQRQKAREDHRKVEAEVNKLRVQRMSDLAMEIDQQEKINAKKAEETRRKDKLAKARKVLADAIKAGKPEQFIAAKRMRVEQAAVRARAISKIVKREEALLAGIFDVAKLKKAKDDLQDLINKKAPQADIDKAQNKVFQLAARQARVQEFVDAQQRENDLIQKEADADAIRETPSEFDEFESLTQTEKAKRIEEWTAYGLIDDAVTGGLIKDFWNDRGTDAMIPVPTDGLLDKINHYRKKGDTWLVKLYQAGDAIWKIRAFEIETERYKKAYPSLTLKEVKDMAAENVKNTYPTFSRVAPLVRHMSKVPIIGAFAAFPAEAIRTFGNTVALAKKEMMSSNPVLRRLGITRMVGLSTSMALPTALSLTTRALLGMDDEDEERLRVGLPEWSKNSTIVFLDKEPVTTPHLTTLYRYIDFGAMDAFAVMKKPFIALCFQRGPLKERSWNALYEGFAPFLNMNVFTAKTNDAFRNQKPNGMAIYLETDSEPTKWRKGAEYVLTGTMPGYMKVIRRMMKAKDQEIADEGKKYLVEDELLGAMGIRISTFDPTFWAHAYASSETNRQIIQLTGELDKVLRQPGLSHDEGMDAVRDYVRGNRRMLIMAGRKYEAAVGLGADPQVMNRIKWPRYMQGFWGEWDEQEQEFKDDDPFGEE